MLRNSLNNCINSAIRKNWDTIYIAIDIHDTIVKGNYKTDELPTEYLPLAKDVLQYLSKRDDVVLMLYTCSHPKEIEKYIEFFKNDNINFQYCNENPEVPNNALGCYDKKLYFNLLLDDKAGFDGNTEWYEILEFFINTPSLKK